MYSAEEELDEMVARIVRRTPRSITRPGRDPLARTRARRFGIRSGHAGYGSGCGGACGCGCTSCGGEADEAATRGGAPRAAGGETPASAVSTQLPAWRGWSAPQRLSVIAAARAGGTPPGAALAEFLDRGARVYRITREGVDVERPLSIGMTISNSIFERVNQHFTNHRDADRNVASRISTLQPSQVIVQAALLDRNGMHPRRAKSYENWLQDRERPLTYNPNTITFEESGRVRRDY